MTITRHNKILYTWKKLKPTKKMKNEDKRGRTKKRNLLCQKTGMKNQVMNQVSVKIAFQTVLWIKCNM